MMELVTVSVGNSHEGERTWLLKPPPEKGAAISLIYLVPPTDVTLGAFKPDQWMLQLHQGTLTVGKRLGNRGGIRSRYYCL